MSPLAGFTIRTKLEGIIGYQVMYITNSFKGIIFICKYIKFTNVQKKA